MLNQFYNYLAENIIKYFKGRSVNSGEKFHIPFEKNEEVLNLYNALKDKSNDNKFIYNIKDSIKYETFILDTGNIDIIVAATNENVTVDFLVKLRNMVGDRTIQEFKDKAILFIHNTTLDSLTKGTISFYKEGMPFNNKNLIKSINSDLKKSNLKKEEQYILKFVLEKMSNEVYEDNSSIFQYANILNVLNNGYIEKENYKEFGLFYDENLLDSKSPKAIKLRLNENANLFSKVDFMHKYGNPEIELEKDFDQKGVSLLKRDNWEYVEYKDVKISKENNENFKKIELKNITVDNNLAIWNRPDGYTEATKRKRNIIVFNKDKVDNIYLNLEFDSDIKKSNFKIDKKTEGYTDIKTNRKTAKIHIKVDDKSTTFAKIKYNDKKSKFEFKVCIVSCEEKILKNINTNFNVNIKNNEKMIVYNSNEEKLILNDSGVESDIEYINAIENHINLGINEKKELIFNSEIEDDSLFIKIDINYNGSIINLAKEEEKERAITITGFKIWKLKREKQESFKYLSNNKIVQGTREYFAKEDFKENLEIEEKIIKNSIMHYTYCDNEYKEEKLNINSKVKESYKNLIEYYRVNELLPSLAYYDNDLIEICKDYLSSIKIVLDNINNDEVLSKEERDLFKLGTIYKLDGEKEVILTPLHPINIAYQLMVNEIIGKEEVDEDILKLLSSKYLIPYIYKNSEMLYKVMDQNHSPEWTYYVDYKVNRYKGSRDYISKLTREKINEFIEHFTYLFRKKGESKLSIKLINLGDCKEVLIGIFDYYVKRLNSGEDIKDIMPINIYIYGDKNIINSFEELSFYNSIEDIKKYFNINLKSDIYSEEDILSLFREKVKVYKKSKKEDYYEYTHLTFYEMDQDIKVTSSSMEDINTGTALKGLLSGVPSVYIKDSYRTGFGSKFSKKENNYLINLVMQYNSLTKAIGTEDPFNDNLSITTSIGEKNKENLNKIYDTSNWVTFIDPKVDLNFFKSDEKARELLIIHYSDQYTTSSGYDAITVTRKSKQYQVIIEEFLESKGVETDKNTVSTLINYFNAVNGDWLLRLISSKSQFPREKLSILSAIKIGLSYFYHPDIIWVPISMEEIFRVSGGIGLNQTDSLFSVKNLTGKTDSCSDDLLFVGIEEKEGNVKVYFYPIEVKIGENNENIIKKAINQANRTNQLIKDNLMENENDINRFKKLMYRNFMMQLTIVSAEKMKLYNIWDTQNWDKIINSDIRTKLLNDEYEISDELNNILGNGCVISFKRDTFFNKVRYEDGCTIIELPEEEGYRKIVMDLEEIKENYISGKSDFDTKQMIIEKYDKSNKEKNNIINTNDYRKEKYELSSENNLIEKVREKEPEEKRSIEIVFGNKKNNGEQLVWYPTDTEKTMHTNTGIIGTMGTGKTQFTKSLITQMYREQKYNIDSKSIGMLIFDYKGDYIDYEFVDATGANVYNIYHLPYNPLSLLKSKNMKPLLPLHTANILKETISKAFNLGIKQETLLRDIIMEAYEIRGIKKGDPATWDKQAPTIQDICRMYFSREDFKEDSLYAALKNLDEFEIFEPDPNKTKNLFDVIDGVTVINLSQYDENIQNLVVAITLDIFYSQMLVEGESKQENGHRQLNKLILVDEADNFLSKNFNSIKKILKEGRMFGVGTILSTQFLSHFSTSENDYQNYILTWIIHNVSELNNKEIKFIFNTKNKSEEDEIYNKIKTLAKHESLVKLQNENGPVYIKDKAFWELNKK